MPQRRNRFTVTAALFGVLFLASGPILADDNRITIPLPPHPPLPKIVLPSPPVMIWLPGPKVYVAHETPHQIFNHDGHYYLHHQDAWYIGPGYSGPWTAAKERQIPPGLRKYRGEHWGEYQRDAAQRFREGQHHGRSPYYASEEKGRARKRADWENHDPDQGRHADNDNNEKYKHGRGRND